MLRLDPSLEIAWRRCHGRLRERGTCRIALSDQRPLAARRRCRAVAPSRAVRRRSAAVDPRVPFREWVALPLSQADDRAGPPTMSVHPRGRPACRRRASASGSDRVGSASGSGTHRRGIVVLEGDPVRRGRRGARPLAMFAGPILVAHGDGVGRTPGGRPGDQAARSPNAHDRLAARPGRHHERGERHHRAERARRAAAPRARDDSRDAAAPSS